MGICSDCRLWLTKRVTKYEDGSVVVNYESPPGKARCEVLGIETGTQFGCNSFEEGHDHIEIMATKTGSPWHHSHYEDCPDCKGRGIPQESEGSCARCCGTGHVLFYDDGYVGEERTRRHPNEGEIGPPPKPTCPGCSRDIETSWKACPFCGVKLDQPADPIRTSEFPL